MMALPMPKIGPIKLSGVALINIINIYSCNNLTEDLTPINIKTIFNDLDQHIIVWYKAEKIKANTEVTMEWFNPENKRVFSIQTTVEKTTNQQPFRYFWSIMKFNLINGINVKTEGKWTVVVKPFNIEHELYIKKLTTSTPHNPSIAVCI